MAANKVFLKNDWPSMSSYCRLGFLKNKNQSD